MMAKLVIVLTYVDARLGEASTWSAFSALLVALHVNVSSDLMHALTIWGAVGAGWLGFLLKEQSSGKGAGQTAQDILNALIALTNKKEP